MKNNKMLLFAGVLAAFLMLAVPFAVASVDSEDVDAADAVKHYDIYNEADLRAALTSTEFPNIELDLRSNLDIQITEEDAQKTIWMSPGDKTINLNGFDIDHKGWWDTSTKYGYASLFGYKEAENGSLTINGTGSTITTDATVVFLHENVRNYSLNVVGGEYVSTSDYHQQGIAFNIYSKISDSNVNVKFENIKIVQNNTAGIWFGNGGAENVTLTNVDVESDNMGIYLGSVNNAILTNVTVNSTSTALEIKSGNVRINNSSFTSSTYEVSDREINNDGYGEPKSTIFINNKYLTAAGAESTIVDIGNNVTIVNNATDNDVKPVVVASGNAVGLVSLIWNGSYSDVFVYYVNADDSDVNINGYLMVDNYADMTSALSTKVKKIGLTNDIELSGSPKVDQAFTINYGVEINGFGHSIETDGYERIFKVSVNNEEVTFINLNASCNNGIQYPRVINIIDSVNASIDIINCTFVAGHYAVNITQNNTGTEIDVNNSYIRGYAAFNIWSSADIEVDDSIIHGVNRWALKDEQGEIIPNSFAAITIYGTERGIAAPFVNIDISNSKLLTDAISTAYEYVINYEGGAQGKLTLNDVDINCQGLSYSMYLADADVEFNGTVTIVDDSAEELYLGGNTYLNGIIVDEGKGSITANVTGNGYVTGSNVAAWASTGAQKLDSDSATVGPGQSVTDINSSSNTVIIQTTTQQPGSTLELNDSLTVNVRDNGKEMSVELPAGSQISDNALVHMSQVGYSADGNKQFEITLSGIDNAGMDIYITIPRENNGLDAKVFWIKDDGSRVLMDNLSDDRSSVTFITTHNSLYELVYVSSGGSAPGFTPGMGTVTEEASEGFSTADYATMVGIIIAVVMLIGLVCIVRRN